MSSVITILKRLFLVFIFFLILFVVSSDGDALADVNEQMIYEADTYSITRIAKIAGTTYLWDEQEDIGMMNDKYMNVGGTDLGAITRCGQNYYLNFGDTIFGDIVYQGSNPTGWSGQNFLVAVSNSTPEAGLEFQTYLGGGDQPTRALSNCHNISETYGGDRDGCYTIPNAMFSIFSGSSCVGMYAQYMDVANVSGHNHRTYASYIAKMNWDTGLFEDYKPSIYKWTIDGAPDERYDFAMASFVQVDDYLYMFGSPSGRYGGLKVARIEVTKFIDPGNTEGWQYYTVDDTWQQSLDMSFIRDNAKWVIPPKDDAHNYIKDYGSSEIDKMTIAEFSVVFDPFMQKYLLITGRPDVDLGIYMYTADDPEGPWIETELLPNQDYWTYYGTYTSSPLLSEDGRNVYFLSTTWQPYGVYLYKATFDQSWSACVPDCSGKECGDDGCQGSCGTCDDGYICDENMCVNETLQLVDINSDGSVDLDDYSDFVLDYLLFAQDDSDYNGRSDIDDDGEIDMNDYSLWVYYYLEIVYG